jgi:hypothetical protein
MNLMRAFGMVLSPVLKNSKALSLEGMTRRRSHHMLSMGKTREQCDATLLEGISPDRHFEMDFSTETSRAVQQQDLLMPDPTPSQPWSVLGGEGELAGVYGWPNERNTAAGHEALAFAPHGGTFDMNMIDHTGGLASFAGPSNVQRGSMGQNRGRGW